MSLTCPTCSQKFTDKGEIIPLVLNCGDSICKKCLMKRQTNDIFDCPLCLLKSKKKIDELPINKFIFKPNKTIVCELCLKEFGDNASSENAPKILNCGETFCTECLKHISKNGVIKCSFCLKITKEDIIDIPINNYVLDFVGHEIYSNAKDLKLDKNMNINDIEIDMNFSIGLMGEMNGGKTSIAYNYRTGQTAEHIDTLSTIGFDYHFKILNIGNKIVKITLWDTAGQEQFGSLAAGTLRGVHGLLLVFSLAYEKQANEKENFLKMCDSDKEILIDKYTKEVFDHVSDLLAQFKDFNKQSKRVIYLIGNKVDNEKYRIIREEDSIMFAKKNKLTYFETSAHTGKNIDKVFEKMTLELMKLYPKSCKSTGKKLENEKDDIPKKPCCLFRKKPDKDTNNEPDKS